MVYVVQEQSNKNILPAKEYGEIKVLIPPGSQVTFCAEAITFKLLLDLEGFTDDDYLLLIGDPVAIGISVAVAAHWNDGRVKMLKWDRQEKQYCPIEMDINQERRK